MIRWLGEADTVTLAVVAFAFAVTFWLGYMVGRMVEALEASEGGGR